VARDDSRRLRQRLASLADAGVLQLPRPSVAGGRVESGSESAEPRGPAGRAAEGDGPRAGEAADRVSRLEVLRAEVAACQRCQALAAARTHTVFGSGNPSARICFFGEAPGADEDASGEPFVGRAGQLLTKIIEACGLSREQVYILNVLKCRPPGNRQPEPGEVANCRGYFERQFEIIRPEFIICLGTTASQSLLASQQTIGRLRNTWHRYGSADVICTYHPSYLLRNPAAKRDVWDDMKQLMARAGMPVPES
jgi:uracil-DNA glycosylase family 4